ncbi:MAG: hypothetical protein HOY71_22380 [Nonomuraea sp.]|nr:hypothetical protein [Nonomuraea sp.]
MLKAFVALIGVLLLTAVPAGAAPKPTIKQLKRELSDLQKESDKVIKDYYEGRIAQQKADKASKSASDKLKAATEVFDREAVALRTLAVADYMGGGGDQLARLMGNTTPEAYLSQMALSQHLVDGQNLRLRGFAAVRDGYQKAQAEASAKAEELDTLVADLGERKKKAEKLIDKIKDKIDQLYHAPGVKRSDGTWVPQLPGGEDNITPRMRLVKDLIKERFGDDYGIGCYRSIQDGGEHPLGRACDFMLSRGGSMPTAAEVARGYAIANWVIKNAKRLGIMYVIYRQRIWHVQRGYWRTMTNRGGVTANHFDHPHVSVY